MYPVLRLLGFTLPIGALAVLLAFYVGTEVGSRATRWLADSIETGLAWNEAFSGATFYGLLAGLVGARLGYALRYFDLYVAEPGLLLSLRPGTLAFVPGVLVGLGIAIFYCYHRQLPFSVFADGGAVGTLAALVVWNMGQFFTGDAYGVPGNVPWTITLWGAERHPVQLYVAAALLVGLGALWWQRRDARPGQIFWRAMLIYGAVELFLTAFRANPFTWGPGIRVVQVYALIATLAAMFVLSYYAQQRSQTEMNGNSRL